MKNVRVAAVQLWSDASRTPVENRAHALEMASKAAEASPDLVVLPEAVAMLCYPDGRPDFSYRDVCEDIPGPTSDALCEIARRYSTNIVAGLIEDRGEDRCCQNVAIIIDRSGNLVGKYEKLHEPQICREEQAAGTGNSIPVFDLDFGRIGILICWDLISPETASILAYKGAELLCFPHLIGLPSPGNFSIQIRARAIDTGIPVVAAGMRDDGSHSGTQDGLSPTCIIDADGVVVAQAMSDAATVITGELDLSSESPNRIHRSRAKTDLRLDVLAENYAALARDNR